MTPHQQAVITRLQSTIPSSQHHIINHLVLVNQIGIAEKVAEEFAKAHTLQAETLEAFSIAQEETNSAALCHVQSAFEARSLRKQVSTLQYDLRVSGLQSNAFQDRLEPASQRIAELEYELDLYKMALQRADDVLASAESTLDVVIEYVKNV